MKLVQALLLATLSFAPDVLAQGDTAPAMELEDSLKGMAPSNNDSISTMASEDSASVPDSTANAHSAVEAAQKESMDTVAEKTQAEPAESREEVAETAEDAGGADAEAVVDTVEQTASMTINSVPSGAVLIVDGKNEGTTPVQVTGLVAGDHEIQLRKKGFFLKKATVILQPGASEEISLELTAPSTIVVTSEPSGASVLLGGRKIGKTPARQKTLKPGEYTVRVEHQGYERYEQTLTLKSGAKDSVHAVLEKSAAADQENRTEKTQQRRDQRGLSLIDKVALGVFAAFTAIILVVELAGMNEE